MNEFLEKIRSLVWEKQGLKKRVEVLEDFLTNRDIKDCNEKLLGLLTRRERDVAHLLALGYDNAEIAERLDCAVSTVGNYISQVYCEASEIYGNLNRVKLALLILKAEGRLKDFEEML